MCACPLSHLCIPADWSTEGCATVAVGAETVTCECNHLTAFSILQVWKEIRTHTHTYTTCVCYLMHFTQFLLYVCVCIQSPAVPTTSTQPVLALVVTLPVVGGAVLLILAVTGGAYLIWRCVCQYKMHINVRATRTCTHARTHTHAHAHTHTHAHTHACTHTRTHAHTHAHTHTHTHAHTHAHTHTHTWHSFVFHSSHAQEAPSESPKGKNHHRVEGVVAGNWLQLPV